MKKNLLNRLSVVMTFVALVIGNTALAQYVPKTLTEYDKLVGTYDYLHPERFEMLKLNPDAPEGWRSLFTPEEFAIASENHTVVYEAAVRMGLFSPEVQRQLGITRIEHSNYSLTVYTRDEYGNWRFFLTAGDFNTDFIKLVSLSQDDRELGKMTQIHLSRNHSKLLKQGVDMWLYVESKVTNEYTRRSAEVVKTQVKVMSEDLLDPKGLYVTRVIEAKQKAEAKEKAKAKAKRAAQKRAAKMCSAILIAN